MLSKLNIFYIKIKNLKNILSGKIVLQTPDEKEILIFNSWQIEVYKDLFENRKYFGLETPDKAIKKIYFSKTILKFIILEILKGNFKLSYYLSIIKVVNPKLIVTTIDNDLRFCKLAKILEKKIKFCAIQNAYRDMHYLNKKQASNIYIPHYLCFGEQTKDHFKKIGAQVKNFYIVGSYKQSMAEKYLKSKNLINEKYKYDVCLIGENIPAATFTSPEAAMVGKIRINARKLVAAHVDKLTEKHKLKTILALKRSKDHFLYNEEMNFYKSILNKNTSIIIENKTNDFSSYEKSYNSKVTVGTRSSILLETFARGNKILSCNYNKDYFSNYSELNPLLSFDSYFSISGKSYDEFEKRILLLLSMKVEDFDKYSENIRNYMLAFNKSSPAFEKINLRIDEFLK